MKFIAAAMRSPLKIGGFLPSSRGLAKAMAAPVDLAGEGAVVELGAGTGVVTQALLKHGVSPDNLLVIERDEGLFALLVHHMPQLNILQADALELDNVLESVGVARVNALVSSLPFLVMPGAVRDGIQEQMARVIGDSGIIVQFTYGPKSPILPAQQRRLGLVGKRVKIVVTNVPPAHVWVYRKERRKKPR